MKIIGIDHGNSHVKTCHKSFVSGLHVYQDKPAEGEYLKWNDRFFVLSNNRLATQKDKTETDDFRVLTMFAIAKELQYSRDYVPGMEIGLAIGLPPEHMTSEASVKAWGSYFTSKGRTWNFEYNGKPYSVKIEKVHVYNQGYAIVFLDPKAYEQHSTSYIVDIGGYTCDVLRLNNARMDPSMRLSLNLGVITFLNEAKSQTNAALRYTPNDGEILDYVMYGKANRPELAKIFGLAFDQYCTRLINELGERGIDLRYATVKFCGGGSQLLKVNLKKAAGENKGVSFEDDIKANARGYQTIMEAKLKMNRG